MSSKSSGSLKGRIVFTSLFTYERRSASAPDVIGVMGSCSSRHESEKKDLSVSSEFGNDVGLCASERHSQDEYASFSNISFRRGIKSRRATVFESKISIAEDAGLGRAFAFWSMEAKFNICTTSLGCK